jgi:hypothetical protein
MTPEDRSRYAEALQALIGRKMPELAVARDWKLLEEVARLAASDAPTQLAKTDPALFEAWRAAVTYWHLAGWSNMTPERVREVAAAADAGRDRARRAE